MIVILIHAEVGIATVRSQVQFTYIFSVWLNSIIQAKFYRVKKQSQSTINLFYQQKLTNLSEYGSIGEADQDSVEKASYNEPVGGVILSENWNQES